MSTFQKTLSVKEMNPSDQPRERLQQLGPDALTDAELMAILLRTGNKHHNVISMSQKLLSEIGGLGKLNRKSWLELQNISGMGPVKAITIAAAMELGRRAISHNFHSEIRFHQPRSIANYFMPMLKDQRHEQFVVVFLNHANALISHKKISSGGPTATVVDIPEILKQALLHDAQGIVVIHNHPSGSVSPSGHDRTLTQRIKDGCDFVGITLKDHIIIGGGTFFSFRDENLIL